MKIGIDARLLSYRRGMGNFLYNLLYELADLDQKNRYVLYTNQSWSPELTLPDNFQSRVLGVPAYPLWEQVALPLVARRDGVSVLHCPANTGPWWIPKEIKLVLTIHDVMYLLPTSVLPASPSLYQRLGRLYRRVIVPSVARRAAAIVTDSYYSRQDIIEYIGLKGNHVAVVWGAPNRACRLIEDKVALAEVRAKYTLHKPFILALAGIDPRKNTARVIEAFGLLLEKISTDCQLALVGLPPAAQAPFAKLAQQMNIADRLLFTDFIPEDDLAALYNMAEVFVYPSLYEGFGLPVLEAMACGTPVVTSPVGSIPEITGEAVLFVDPSSVTAIGQGIMQILTDPELARNLRSRGLAQVSQFSWRQAVREMLCIYEDAVQS